MPGRTALLRRAAKRIKKAAALASRLTAAGAGVLVLVVPLVLAAGLGAACCVLRAAGALIIAYSAGPGAAVRCALSHAQKAASAPGACSCSGPAGVTTARDERDQRDAREKLAPAPGGRSGLRSVFVGCLALERSTTYAYTTFRAPSATALAVALPRLLDFYWLGTAPAERYSLMRSPVLESSSSTSRSLACRAC
jgi:hypothetical protein